MAKNPTSGGTHELTGCLVTELLHLHAWSNSMAAMRNSKIERACEDTGSCGHVNGRLELSVDFDDLLTGLFQNGFAFFPDAIDSSSSAIDVVTEVAERLGTPNIGRGGVLVEALMPRNSSEAMESSLSRNYGLGRLPFHIDTAHHPVPSRFLVFACTAANGDVAPTYLLHYSRLSLSKIEDRALRHGVFLVRNGRNSFFANVASTRSSFIRWDPGCMLAKDKYAEIAATALGRWPQEDHYETVSWSAGDLLVVDNWQMLHARGAALPVHGERSLLRITVK